MEELCAFWYELNIQLLLATVVTAIVLVYDGWESCRHI